jgi:putative hydrolase of the HAD superfamily
MSVRAVFLDFFGTLARSIHSVGLDTVMERHGYSLPAHLQEIWWSGDIDGLEHVEQSASREHYLAWQRERLLAMLAQADVHPGEYDVILDDLHAGRSERVLEAYTEVPDVLRDLRERGLLLVVCSNWDWDLAPAVDEVGLTDLVDVLVSSAWAGARKPHPRIFEHTLERAGYARPGIGAGDVLFVGDTWGPDVEGPLAVGMTPAYLERDGHWPDLTCPTAAEPAVEPRAVARIRDLTGVLPLVER